MTRPLRIAIASLGRYHVLDLARELAALGHDVRFYSYVPKKRAVAFGLPASCHVALLPALSPLVVAQRLLPARLGRRLDGLLHRAADAAVRARMQPCDVFIGMGGIYLEAARDAKARYGARVCLERGSRHILSQREILSRLPGCEVPPKMAVRRALAGYDLADAIVIPSRHVEESFLERGIPATRLFRNPYGVDLSHFRPSPRHGDPRLTALFVGLWSLQKGADVLVRAAESLEDLRVIHVGALGDCPFPRNVRFVHHPPVEQRRLDDYYTQADLLVLPSRQEGLALVQLQALASGVPVVCTTMTGGADLRENLPTPAAVEVVEPGDAHALADGLRAALARTLRLRGRDLLGPQREHFSWRAYGQRYSDFLGQLMDRAHAC